MTDDVTRGLGLLADEVEAAAIDTDTDAVIAAATRRTRTRAILTTSLATIVLVGTLVMTLITVKADQDTTAGPPPPPRSTPWIDHASPAEQEERRTRLYTEITNAFDRILPNGWQHSTFDWGCDNFHCWAFGDVLDGNGTISMSLGAAGYDTPVSCDHRTNCTMKVLDDGTRVAFGKSPGSTNEPRAAYDINAKRPDRTITDMTIWWSTDRPAPELTDEQWIDLVTAFTY